MNILDATRRAERTAPARPPLQDPIILPRVLRSSKILDQHLDRLAIVYVRQSDPQQVLNHRESRERQYALAELAAAWGWPRDRILIIDDDQGLSGRTADQRSGFQRILAEVTMEHVGLVLGIEMSRIARNNKDWHNLLEMCAIFGTLLADEDGVYDPRDTNDRLLLGLKGTISEFELVTMRNRLERGRLHKAQRGELFHRVPTGYIKLSSERVEMDPDEQVREVVRLIFDKYDETRDRLGRLPLPDPQQHPPRVSAFPRAQSREPGVAAAGPADHLPDPAASHLRRGLYLWPPAPQAHPDSHGRTHHRRQLGADGPVEGPETRLPAGLHHVGPLPGESGIACTNIARVRAPRGALATAPRCWPASSSAAIAAVAFSRPIGAGQALLQLRPAPPRGEGADVLRPQGRRRLTTWWRNRSCSPWNPPPWS